jgi:nucleotide-binding universal stress UspA family protein
VTYTTLMVHLELGRSNAGVLRIAAALAERLGASVIGISACQPTALVYGDGYVDGSMIEAERKELARETAAAEAEFRTALQGSRGPLQWRSSDLTASLPAYIAAEARAADLFITGVATGDLFDASRAVDTGGLVLQLGRPVLLVPASVAPTRLERAVVAWRDTREARRAISDALPLLKAAAHVAVVEIVAEADRPGAEQRLADVVAWLARHGIGAEPLTVPGSGDDAAAICTLTREQHADLVVAGAYGHSRLREWAFGGVTRDLLMRADCCALVSH